MNSQKGRVGQRIGTVADDSPSGYVGLKPGQRVLKVNRNSVVRYSHSEVVQAIQMNPEEVELLVTDQETEDFYKAKGIEIETSSLTNIEYIDCSDRKPEGELWLGAPSFITMVIYNHNHLLIIEKLILIRISNQKCTYDMKFKYKLNKCEKI